VWRDVLTDSEIHSITQDVSVTIDARGMRGVGIQNLSPYTISLVADTGRLVLLVPPWSERLHHLDIPCSFLEVSTSLAYSPSSPNTYLAKYVVRLLLTHEPLQEMAVLYA
jgi:hypothetical protein